MQAILEKIGHSLAHTVPLETAKTKGSSNVRLLPFLMSAFLHWSVSLTLEAGLLSQAGNMAARSLGLTSGSFPTRKAPKASFLMSQLQSSQERTLIGSASVRSLPLA